MGPFRVRTVRPATLLGKGQVEEIAETAKEQGAGLLIVDAALTPIQQRFFAQGLANPHHYNQAVLLETDNCPEVSELEAVMQKLVTHHAA